MSPTRHDPEGLDELARDLTITPREWGLLAENADHAGQAAAWELLELDLDDLAACLVCGDPTGVACCEYGRDPIRLVKKAARS